MRIEWLNKISSDRVIIFFNGWGMDAAAVSHLKADCSVIMVYDYRTLESCRLPNLESFREIYVIAWSMGVWAASETVSRMNISPTACIALNGTERPVDDEYGIPLKIYMLTEKGMSAQGRDKFLLRMLDGTKEIERFEANKPQRSVEEVCEELVAIRRDCTGGISGIKWNKVYVSDKDIIFPVRNQLNWWQGKTPVTMLPGGHYPFYHFANWKEIIAD